MVAGALAIRPSLFAGIAGRTSSEEGPRRNREDPPRARSCLLRTLWHAVLATLIAVLFYTLAGQLHWHMEEQVANLTQQLNAVVAQLTNQNTELQALRGAQAVAAAATQANGANERE